MEAVRALQAEYQEAFSRSGIPCPSFPASYPTSCLLGCVDVGTCVSQADFKAMQLPPHMFSASPFVWICRNPKRLLIPLRMSGNHKLWQLSATKVQLALKSVGAQERSQQTKRQQSEIDKQIALAEQLRRPETGSLPASSDNGSSAFKSTDNQTHRTQVDGAKAQEQSFQDWTWGSDSDDSDSDPPPAGLPPAAVAPPPAAAAPTKPPTLPNFKASKFTALVAMPEEGGELWRRVQRIRGTHDRQFGIWPPHVTLLYPFVPPSLLPVAAKRLAATATVWSPAARSKLQLRRFSFFTHGKRSATVWLQPDSSTASDAASATTRQPVVCWLHRLQRGLESVFPSLKADQAHHRLGTHRFVPHMTVAQTTGEREAKALIRTLRSDEPELDDSATLADMTLCILQRTHMGAPMKIVKTIDFL